MAGDEQVLCMRPVYHSTIKANLVPRARSCFGQHQECGLWPSPLWMSAILRLSVVYSAENWLPCNWP